MYEGSIRYKLNKVENNCNNMAKRSKAPTSLTTPPWVWGPSEGYQWAKIAYTGEGRGGKREEKRTREDTMSNPHVYVELDAKKNVLSPDGELQKLLARGLDLEKTCEGFDIIVTAEKFLRVLAHIKIKNVTEIKNRLKNKVERNIYKW